MSDASKRLAKAISDSGYCSRRDAEKLITDGRVTVDGEIINTPAFNVTDGSSIAVDGTPIASKVTPKLWLYHKPVGLMTTHKDPQNRPTVFEHLPRALPRVISVGRLDINSEGLLLLTNSGELARKLELPSNKYDRVYKVRAFGNCDIKKLQTATAGIKIKDEFFKPTSIILVKPGKNSWLEVTLQEGKNREIRKIFEHFDMQVNRLIRVQYGPWKLGQLNPGEVMEVPICV